VDLRAMKYAQIKSPSQLTADEILAYKAMMLKKYAIQEAEIRVSPLAPKPKPRENVINNTQYEKWEKQLVENPQMLRKFTVSDPDIPTKEEAPAVSQLHAAEQQMAKLQEKFSFKFEELEFDQLVGSGASGEVHLGYIENVAVAIKKIAADTLDKENRALVEQEIRVMRNLHHPNIVKFMGLCDHETGVYIVTEYIEHGDLFDLCVFGEGKELPWNTRALISLQMAYACGYLHENNIMHRDLKSQNILIGNNYLVKLCDFGLACSTDIKAKRKRTVCGTDEWIAPEIALDEEYNHMCDIFSWGIVVTEIIFCEPPRKRKMPDKMAFDMTLFRQNLPEDCPKTFADIVVAACEFNPDKRPDFLKIVKDLETLIAALK